MEKIIEQKFHVAHLKDYNCCPVCGEMSVGCCRCMKSDSQCASGHEWHRCLAHDKTVLGSSDHSMDTRACSCI